MKKLRIGIVGARGYVGAELVTLLAQREDVELAWLTSSSDAGTPVRERIVAAPAHLTFAAADPEARLAAPVDVVVLALPNGQTGPWTKAIDARQGDAVVIDLGSDHRFERTWTYGLPARRREAIRRAKRIANPGCYATAMQIALDPVVAWLHGPVHVFGVSGYSGAGTAPSPRNDREKLADNVLPYSLVGHTHEREVTSQLDHPVRLLPHVAPFFRGITVTVAGRFAHEVSRDAVRERFVARWKDEPLVHVQEEAPLVRNVTGQHAVFVGGIEVGADGRSFGLVATIDNLLGGAATTAVRNINLATGRDELLGIEP